jgi:hypothetical protein
MKSNRPRLAASHCVGCGYGPGEGNSYDKHARKRGACEGLYLAKLEEGSVLDLEMESRHYRIEYLGGEQVRISGHPLLCPTLVIAQLKGSANDCGSIELGFIGRGMHLMFRRSEDRAPVATPMIAEIRLLSPLLSSAGTSLGQKGGSRRADTGA